MSWCWIGLVGVAFSGVLALLTHDPRLFFLRSVIADAGFGLAMLGSLVIRKPLIGLFASWVVTMPDDYKTTAEYRRSFDVLTLVWGVVNVMRAAGRGYLMANGSLEQLMLVNLATGWPVFAVLVAFSVWYPNDWPAGSSSRSAATRRWPTRSCSAASRRPSTSSCSWGPRSRRTSEN